MNKTIIPTSFKIHHLLIVLVILHAFAFSSISNDQLVFDEIHYVPAARDILEKTPSNLEHPFLGKFWGSIGILTLGDNPFGWRMPVVIFGFLTVIVFYYFAANFLSKQNALIATTFLAFDNIIFLHSSFFLLEIPALFFTILAFLLYEKKRYSLMAISMGLAVLSKEWSLLFVFVLVLYHILKFKFIEKENFIKKTNFLVNLKILLLFSLVVIAPLWVYLEVFNPLVSFSTIEEEILCNDQTGKCTTQTIQQNPSYLLNNPIDQLQFIMDYQSSFSSYNKEVQPSFWNDHPWGWIIPYDVKPLIYYPLSETSSNKADNLSDSQFQLLGIGNFPLWLSLWLILPFVTIKITKRKFAKIHLLIISWILLTFFSWVFVALLFERATYAFYFIMTVPILALAIPQFIEDVFTDSLKKKVCYILWVGLTIGFFFYYFPYGLVGMNFT